MRTYALVRVLCILSFILPTFAQILSNGQTYSRGLAIVNAPAPSSEHTAGGVLPISIEVSGNGRIPFDGLVPASRLPTAYEELNLFLVSSQTEQNVTISSGPQLLADEAGTVRHLNWRIPTCVLAGQYNVTLYEVSRFNDQDIFAITPIPIKIRNPEPDVDALDCSDLANALSAQPQPDNSIAQSPFLPPQSGTTSASETSTALPNATVGRDQRSGMVTSTGIPQMPTDTVPMEVLPSQEQNRIDLSGFVFVNSGRRTLEGHPLGCLIAGSVMAMTTTFWAFF